MFKNRVIFDSKAFLYIGCILAGAMGVIPYFIESLFIFTFVSFITLFCILKQYKRTQRRVFRPFFCYFIGFYVPLYSFLSELYPFERFGFTESQAIFVVICSCVLIPMLHAAVFALVMSVAAIATDNIAMSVKYGALWSVGEAVLSLGTLAFPWGNTAISMTGFLPYIQTVSVFGKSFITFLTVTACHLFATALTDKRRKFALIGASMILCNTVVGTILLFLPDKNEDAIKVAAIQGNVLSNEKWVSGNSNLIFQNYIDLTQEAAENGAEIILLPESAIPKSFNENGSIHTALAEIAERYGSTIIAGVQCYENKNTYNSVICVYTDGTLSERYDKRHLVPFGEFIPFANTLGKLVPFVGALNENSGAFTEGKYPVTMPTEYGVVAPLVCFDSIFSTFARESVNEGANMLAIVTNDSWFNDSVGIYTHLRHAQLRAIENNRYVLRAANTGVSSFIDNKGRIIDSTKPLTSEILYSEVKSIESKTLYTKTDDLTLIFSLIIVLYIFKQALRRKRNGKNTTASN